MAPLLLILGGLWLVMRLADWQHTQDLPNDYERLTTEHFDVYYPDGLRERAERVVEEAERFLWEAPKAFSSLLGDISPPGQRIRLTLFRNHSEFSTFTQSALQDDMSSNGGYFDAVRLEIVLVLTESNIDSLGIRHEVAHLLVARGGGRFGTQMPRWLNEGLATWLETVDLRKPTMSGPLVGWIRLVAAASAKRPTIVDVTKFDDAAFRSEDNELAYAYANLLVHYLVERDSAAFFKFARAVRDGGCSDREGFKRYFSGVDALEPGFQSFLRDLVSDFDQEYRESILRGDIPPIGSDMRR